MGVGWDLGLVQVDELPALSGSSVVTGTNSLLGGDAVNYVPVNCGEDLG
jgi:hypothetical protein